MSNWRGAASRFSEMKILIIDAAHGRFCRSHSTKNPTKFVLKSVILALILNHNLEKIFEAFERVDSNKEGLGLGLAIMTMHDGTIHAHSDGLAKERLRYHARS